MPVPDIDTVELTDWLWCLGTRVVQLYAVREGDGFNLIDAGLAGTDHAILRSLAAINGSAIDDVRVGVILLTHGHDDHYGAAAGLAKHTGAQVLAPALDTAIIEGRQVLPLPVLSGWEVKLFEQVRPLVPDAPPVHVDRQIEAGALLRWEKAVSIVAAPGHTAGSVAVLFPDQKVLVAGDAIASHQGQPQLGVFNQDPDRARASLCHLATLDVEIVCFGHGDALLVDAGQKLRAAAARLAP